MSGGGGSGGGGPSGGYGGGNMGGGGPNRDSSGATNVAPPNGVTNPFTTPSTGGGAFFGSSEPPSGNNRGDGSFDRGANGQFFQPIYRGQYQNYGNPNTYNNVSQYGMGQQRGFQQPSSYNPFSDGGYGGMNQGYGGYGGMGGGYGGFGGGSPFGRGMGRGYGGMQQQNYMNQATQMPQGYPGMLAGLQTLPAQVPQDYSPASSQGGGMNQYRGGPNGLSSYGGGPAQQPSYESYASSPTQEVKMSRPQWEAQQNNIGQMRQQGMDMVNRGNMSEIFAGLGGMGGNGRAGTGMGNMYFAEGGITSLVDKE